MWERRRAWKLRHGQHPSVAAGIVIDIVQTEFGQRRHPICSLKRCYRLGDWRDRKSRQREGRKLKKWMHIGYSKQPGSSRNHGALCPPC